jgi:hypothetical protein
VNLNISSTLPHKLMKLPFKEQPALRRSSNNQRFAVRATTSNNKQQ